VENKKRARYKTLALTKLIISLYMLTKKEKIIAKIFNNFLGRKFLNVPKGKNIYKIATA